MKHPTPVSIAMFLGVALIALPIASQAQSGLNADYTAPRTSYGHPDLQGIWSNATITPLERPRELSEKAFMTAEEAEQYEADRLAATNRDRRTGDKDADVRNAYNDFWWDSGDNIVATRRTSLIVDPPDGRIPEFTAAGRARLETRPTFEGQRSLATFQEYTDGPEDQDLMTRCIYFGSAGPPMLPSAYNNNYHLVQTENHVLIVNEMVHETRVIPLDGRPPLTGAVRQWLGSSRGHWDGETLVVETTNFTPETGFRGASENMRLTERFTRIDDEMLLYEFTVDDPDTFTEPWTAQIPSVKADGLMYEYACHEGNRGMEGILAGARAAEKAAAAGEQGN